LEFFSHAKGQRGMIIYPEGPFAAKIYGQVANRGMLRNVAAASLNRRMLLWSVSYRGMPSQEFPI